MADILEEWKKLRPMLGDMICHMDSKMAQIEAEEKRIQEKRDESYIRGMNDAWETARFMDAMTPTECLECFGDGGGQGDCYYYIDGIHKLTPQEAISKIHIYMEKKKTQQVFHVGDQVTAEEGSSKFFITNITPETGCVSGIDYKGRAYSYFLEDLTKTGVHSDGIQQLMKSMEAIK